MTTILGLHHVTAIAGDPQRNLDFYTGVLGLRLVKLTVNFDDPGTYHFYFADANGTPGSIMTFFPWPHGRAGRHGTGQVAVTSFSIASGSVGFWIERLLRHNVKYQGPVKRGGGAGGAGGAGGGEGRAGSDGENVISFRDPDGVMLELVGHARAPERDGWDGAGIPREHAIRGFHQVTLWVEQGDATGRLLTQAMGLRELRELHEHETTRRYVAGDGGPGRIVDVRSVGGFGRGADGVGAVHHVAFAVVDDAAELAMRQRVIEAGMRPTPQVDRTYFRSVYFREPGGVLFELATLPPGFTVDEPPEALGRRLMLPPQYEERRAELEALLPPVRLPER